MTVPQDILSVPRQKNITTIAYDITTTTKVCSQSVNRVAAGVRTGVISRSIDHIIDWGYIPNDTDALPDVSVSPISLNDWANIVLYDHIKQDLAADWRRVLCFLFFFPQYLPFG